LTVSSCGGVRVARTARPAQVSPLPPGTQRGKDIVRLRTLLIALVLAVLAAGIVAGPATAKDPSVSKLKQKLRDAKQHRDKARERAHRAAADLAGARELHAATNALGAGVLPDPVAAPVVPPATMSPALAAKLLADGVVTAEEVAEQQARKARTKKLERKWTAKVRSLKKQIRTLKQIADWNRRGKWKPLIEIAAKRYRVSAAGLHRMMMLESTGQRHVVSGPYHGLFQFMHREWNETWNEWRDRSIYDGWSQIQLAAKCISRGMGPHIWPLTYRMAF
jgi:hypothetical protein